MKIALLGDIALFGHGSIEKNPHAKEYFNDVANHLEKYDYVVGNLESPFSYKKKKHGAKSAYLYSEPVNIEILKWLHIDAVTLANNHIFDYGKEAFELTQKLLNEANIAWFGVNGKDHLIEIDGNKIAFSGFCCYSSNPIECVRYGQYGVNELDVENVFDILSQYHSDGYLNICAVHAGIEHVNYPSLDTIKVAKKLSETGNFIYYGHHPHVAQPVQKIGSSLIAYSLGNFCFDDTYTDNSSKPFIELSEDNRRSFILCVTVENNMIEHFEIIPIYIGREKIQLGKGIDKQQLENYLYKMESISSNDYVQMRKEQRASWVATRKANRNISWLLKRLRLRYAKLVFSVIRNKKKYNKHVRRFL